MSGTYSKKDLETLEKIHAENTRIKRILDANWEALTQAQRELETLAENLDTPNSVPILENIHGIERGYFYLYNETTALDNFLNYIIGRE